MISPERNLIYAVYALYLFDCIRWIKPGEVALTRAFWTGWKVWKVDDLSFTLLGRVPVFINPVNFRPGFIRMTGTSAKDWSTKGDLAGSEFDFSCPSSKLFTSCCVCGAFQSLVVLPLLLQSGWFSVFWKPLIILIGLTHTAILAGFLRNGFEWMVKEPRSFWRAFLGVFLNPISALRAGDLLSENIPRVGFRPKTATATIKS
jgi:hypothetical protein